jgi:hypothetical protein
MTTHHQEQDNICSTIVSIDEFGVLRDQLPLILEPFVSGAQWAALVDEVKVQQAVQKNNVCFAALFGLICLVFCLLPVIIIYDFYVLGDGSNHLRFIFVPFLLIPLLFLRTVFKGPKGERWREQMQAIAERTSTQLVQHQHKFVSVHFQWTVLHTKRRHRRCHDSDDDHDHSEVYYYFEFLHGSNSATTSATTVVGRGGVGAITNLIQPDHLPVAEGNLDVVSSRQSTTTTTPLAMTNSNGSTTTTRINVNFGYRVDRTLPLSLESLVSMAQWNAFLDQVDAIKNLETGKRLRRYQRMGLLMFVFFFEVLVVGVALCIHTTIIPFSWWLFLVFPVMLVPVVLLCGRVKKMERQLDEQMHAIAVRTSSSTHIVSVRFQPSAPDADREVGYTKVQEEKFSTKQPYFEFTHHHHSSPLVSADVVASVEWPRASPPNYYSIGGNDDANATRNTIPTVEDDLESNTTLRFSI